MRKRTSQNGKLRTAMTIDGNLYSLFFARTACSIGTAFIAPYMYMLTLSQQNKSKVSIFQLSNGHLHMVLAFQISWHWLHGTTGVGLWP